jgi:hypothetical protein
MLWRRCEPVHLLWSIPFYRLLVMFLLPILAKLFELVLPAVTEDSNNFFPHTICMYIALQDIADTFLYFVLVPYLCHIDAIMMPNFLYYCFTL